MSASRKSHFCRVTSFMAEGTALARVVETAKDSPSAGPSA